MNPDLKAVLDKLRNAELPTFIDVEITGPHAKGLSFGDTPLNIMAIWGDADSAKVLIRNGAEVDARGEDGFTPLHSAVEQDKIEVTRLLLDSGANPYLTTSDGTDAFELARLLGHHEILKLLDERKNGA